MIETDAIEYCFDILQHGGTVGDESLKCARKQLAALKALEPKWLEPGKLPDAEGWWLWWHGELNRVMPVWVLISKDGQHWNNDDEHLFEGHEQRKDRFAPMPRWDGPKD